MRTYSIPVAMAVAAALVVLSSAEVAGQCSVCRLALDSPGAQQLAAAFRSGILFLFAAPFVAFGTVAFLAIRQRRRAVQRPAPRTTIHNSSS